MYGEIELGVIEITGTEISGGDITIFGDDDFTLKLGSGEETLIQASGDITLAVGTNGVVDFSESTGNILNAAGNVNIHSDEVLTDEGVELSDIIQAADITTSPAKILYDISLTGAGGPTLKRTEVRFTLMMKRHSPGSELPQHFHLLDEQVLGLLP